jgi:hypothetical protein
MNNSHNLNEIYETMKINNMNKINSNGFIYDNLLKVLIDNRYCQAIFSMISKKNSFFTKSFDELQKLLISEIDNGILYKLENNDYELFGTLHFTFMQQLSFKDFHILPDEIVKKHSKILKDILVLPFKIYFTKIICISTGLCICGYPDININLIRDQYREKCKENNIELNEPYYNNIIHCTLFRFTEKIDHNKFIEKFKYFLNNDLDYGYVIINNFHMGKGTWKLNNNEIIIDYTLDSRNESTESG